MGQMNAATVRAQVVLSGEEAAALAKVAKREVRSVSATIRLAVQRYLAEEARS
jgi:hypothetical protein